MKKMTRTTLGLALSASVLLAMAAAPAAHAAEEIYYSDSYINREKGIELYSAGQFNGSSYDHAVIARQPDGSFAKWQEPFQYLWENTNGELSLSWSDDPELSYVYDTQSRSILRKTVYDLSPDGSFGFIGRSRYVWVPGATANSGYPAKFTDYYLKNMATGATSVYYSSQGRYYAFWIDQHTLLENRYSEDARQNVISTYNPLTGKRQELLQGSLQNWNPAAGIIQFAKNEPLRRPWVYNLNNGTSRLIKDDAELRTLFPPSPASSTAEVQPPKNIVLGQLPVVEIPVTLTYEYSVLLDGQSVDVATVFTKDGAAWIPVKPLAAALGWSIDLEARTTAAAKAAGYRYTLTAGSTKIICTPANSFVSTNRLYITQAQLKQLGYHSIVLTPQLQQ
ncbi:hypothetical protein [Paenibacillus sp. MMS20-IR301]|uniref:hypothetical protein n=1 Tax=Paenibacillus sp. MMS20-IR301 TaxID=2895946 RepID=UPI0028EEA690|nr:hypothetical protein [Paenibacillus sp. MMS20-IR301]WNS44428.1 hypothetical protein LOS79_03915 [Paenibacillus sp. MMS20-IR301]